MALAKPTLTEDQIQALMNGDVQGLAETLPMESDKAMQEATRLIKRVAKATATKASKVELVDVSPFFPEPNHRRTAICLLKGTRVHKCFHNTPVIDARTGKERQPRGMEAETAKGQLRRYLTENPSEVAKLESGSLTIQVRIDRED